MMGSVTLEIVVANLHGFFLGDDGGDCGDRVVLAMDDGTDGEPDGSTSI